MKKNGFTLIEVIVSIVLVSVVMVSLLGSLIQLRQTYTVIHEDSDIIVYSSSISRVINNDLAKNNGIRYCTCSADGKSCDIILGNDSKRELKILRKCYIDSNAVDCDADFNNEKMVSKTTLQYVDNTDISDTKLIYIRTLELTKYEKNGSIGATGYNFADMSTTVYEHDNGGSGDAAIIDQYTTILIRLNNEINEDISKHDIILYTAGRYNYSNLIGKTFYLELNANGADYAGTTKIDEIFGVGYFDAEENHVVSKQLSSRNPIDIPQNTGKAFLGYFYKTSSGQEIQVIDSTGVVISSSRFFRDNVNANLDNNPDIPMIIAKWADCINGYEIRNGKCVAKEYTVTLDQNGGTGGDDSYKAKYMSLVPNTKVPYKAGYTFTGYSSSGIPYNDSEGKGVYIYAISRDSEAVAQYLACSNSDHVSSWKRNNNCEIDECAKGYHYDASTKTCKGNKYTATFNANGATSISATTVECTVTNDAGNCTLTAPTITRSGFTIEGWNTNKDATAGLPTLTIENNNVTYYAITKKDVVVNFYKNGNGGSDGRESCVIRNRATNCSITAPSITPATGFSKIGWSTASDRHQNDWKPGDSKNLTGSADYYAQSSKTGSTFTATFYRNGNSKQTNSSGTAVTSDSVTRSCTTSTGYNGSAPGTSCNVTSPTITAPSGFTVIGYSGAAATHTSSWNQNTSGSLNANASYYAQSSKAGSTFTATFYRNGNSKQTNSSGTAVTSDSVTRSCTTSTGYNGSATGTSCNVTSPTITAPSGFTVIGYSGAAATHTSSWNQNTSGSLNANASYYAQSSKAAITRSVTYSKGSHVSSIGSTSGSCTIAAVYNGATQGTSCSVTLPTITTGEGYAALGWSITQNATSGNTAAGSSYSLTANTTLYANARAYKCTITFSPNGGKFNKNSNDTVHECTYGNACMPDLYDANGSGGYFYATKDNHVIITGREWYTYIGENLYIYNQNSGYTTEQMCPSIKTGNQSVTLYVNWSYDKGPGGIPFCSDATWMALVGGTSCGQGGKNWEGDIATVSSCDAYHGYYHYHTILCAKDACSTYGYYPETTHMYQVAKDHGCYDWCGHGYYKDSKGNVVDNGFCNWCNNKTTCP